MFSRLLSFSLRLIISTFVVCSFFVLTQDIQIFPGVLSGLLESSQRDADKLPEGVESKFLNTPDGETLELWHLRVDSQLNSNHPVAVFFHGNAENVESSFPLQKWLKSLNIASFSFDYRGYGKSSGWPSDQGIKSDIRTVIDFVSTQYDLQEHALVFIGSSIGTGFAAFASKLMPPAALLLISPYTSLEDLVADLPVFGFLRPFLWYDINTAMYLKGLQNTCLILAHGANDNTIPLKHSLELMNATSHLGRKKFIQLSSAGHNDVLGKGRSEIAKELLKCL